MDTNFLKRADFLREALQAFRTLRYQGSKGIGEATLQLRAALQQVTPLVQHPDARFALSAEQQWGYVLLLWFVQAVEVELQQRYDGA